MRKNRRGRQRQLIALLLAVSLWTALAWAEEPEMIYTENEWNFVEVSMDVTGGIPEDVQGVLGRIRNAGVLRVALEPYFAPQEFIDPAFTGQEQYAGADVELAKLIAERMGVRLEIVPLTFTEVLTAVTEDYCDLAISALAYTPARAGSNTLSKGYYDSGTTVGTALAIRMEDIEEIQGIGDLWNRIIAAQSGSLQEAMLSGHVRRYLEFRRIPFVQDLYEAVAKGAVDAAAVDPDNLTIYLQSHPNCGLMLVPGVQFSLDEQYKGARVAAKKGETQLIAFVNGVIDEVLAQDQYTRWMQDATKRAKELGL